MRSGHAQLANIWPVLDRADEVSVIMVRSEGRAFSAGGAMSLVEDMLANGRTRLRVLREARAIVQNMIDCDKPIVSAINGAAVGAGLAVALAGRCLDCRRKRQADRWPHQARCGSGRPCCSDLATAVRCRQSQVLPHDL